MYLLFLMISLFLSVNSFAWDWEFQRESKTYTYNNNDHFSTLTKITAARQTNTGRVIIAISICEAKKHSLALAEYLDYFLGQRDDAASFGSITYNSPCVSLDLLSPDEDRIERFYSTIDGYGSSLPAAFKDDLIKLMRHDY